MTHASELLETDYLIVGAGALGMAFADTLVAESQASIVIVDKHDQPGGHWNDAYSFVRLHAASANYGVNSTPLGDDTIDQTGLNRGFYEQASAAEICLYFDRLMRKRFLPTGRVRYLPLCEYLEEGNGEARLASLASGAEYRVKVRKRIVDATFTDTAVPSRNPPRYAIAPGMQCVSPNELAKIGRCAKRYVVIGAGKTGMDVCIWLLAHDVPAEQISWITPHDSWLYDRAFVQPYAEFFKDRTGSLALQMELIQQAESIPDLFRRLAQHGQLLRIDERITPTHFRCATVSKAELAELRRIRNVVRLGRVQRIDSDRIVLERGSVPTDYETIHVDCTSSAARQRETVPVFDGSTITLQAIRQCQPCFSAALLAHIELSHDNDAEKNRLSRPIPVPSLAVDWLKMFRLSMDNQYLWSREPHIRTWIANCRLDPNYRRKATPTAEDQAVMQRFKNGGGPAAVKLDKLLKTSQVMSAVISSA